MDWSGHQDTLSQPLYGRQTVQALENFPHRGARLGDRPELIAAIVEVKRACALANEELGELESPVAAAIVTAADEVLSGNHWAQFPLPVIQGGGGTSTNMNVNEVLAALATRALSANGASPTAVHPNDHVNRGQSTNDVMPTAIAVAALPLVERVCTAVEGLAEALASKAVEYGHLDHLGRTCLQDAATMPVSQLHLAQVETLRPAVALLRSAAAPLREVPLGGTAVGTGVGAAPGFAGLALATVADRTRLPLVAARSPTAAMSSLQTMSSLLDAIAGCGRAVARIGSDLRLLGSGPAGGLGEVRLPEMQAGSSIMPGKVNPVLPEFVMQISFALTGAASAAHHATAAGELEVSAMAPVVTLGLLDGLVNLASATDAFTERCVSGLRWREDRVAENLAASYDPLIRTAATIGYDQAALIRAGAEDPTTVDGVTHA